MMIVHERVFCFNFEIGCGAWYRIFLSLFRRVYYFACLSEQISLADINLKPHYKYMIQFITGQQIKLIVRYTTEKGYILYQNVNGAPRI